MAKKREIKKVEKGPDSSIAQVELDTGENLPIEETIRQIKLGTVEGSYMEDYHEGSILDQTANSYADNKDQEIDSDYLEEAIKDQNNK